MNPDWLQYANQGAVRSQSLSPRLVEAFGFLPEMGLQMEVFSGGQPAAGGGARVGSVRHDHGQAADVFFRQNGQRLDWDNPAHLPVFQDVVRRAKAGGVTGFGAGPGYMQPGSMHVGFGNPSVWGAGGKGANAPDWLREAYNGAPMGATPPSAGQGAPATALGDLGGPTATPFMPTDPASTLASLFETPVASAGMNMRRQAEARADEERQRKEALLGGGLFG